LIVFGDQTSLADLPVPTLHVLVQRACGNQLQDLTPVLTEREDELHEVADLHSEAERRLYAALTQAGVAASLKPVVQGYELDFAIDTPTGSVDIEVDGTHHTDARGRQRRQDLARDRVLEGLGWRVLRMPAWQCFVDPAAAATAVGDALRSFAPSA
jgi:very-short-patch-repair endonuclease